MNNDKSNGKDASCNNGNSNPGNNSHTHGHGDKKPRDPHLSHLKRPVNHSYRRRARCHNYSEPGTYFITITVEGRLPLLGTLVPGDEPYIQLSKLGARILHEELGKITRTYPMVQVWAQCIMPDHMHLIVNVSEKLPPKKHLGHVIGGFKGGCSKAWWEICGTGSDDGKSLFEEGYSDGILFDDGQIAGWKVYMKDNPRRLAIKRANPDLFKVWHEVKIGEWSCQMIGNVFLLDILDIMAVVVHRADSDEAFNYKFRQWMECGERGGVLVSAAIAPREKQVMREAMNRGYRLIVLRENGFHRYYKPGGASFDACAEGMMLQVCPWEYHYDNHKIKRSQCLELNALALCISHGR